MSVLLTFTVKQVGFLNPIDLRNIILSSVAITSLYLAWKKFYINKSNILQTFVDSEGIIIIGGNSEEKKINGKKRDIELKGVEFVNGGNQPLTISSLEYLIATINLDQELVDITTRKEKPNLPLGSAEKNRYTINRSADYYKVYPPVYITSVKEKRTGRIYEDDLDSNHKVRASPKYVSQFLAELADLLKTEPIVDLDMKLSFSQIEKNSPRDLLEENKGYPYL